MSGNNEELPDEFLNQDVGTSQGPVQEPEQNNPGDEFDDPFGINDRNDGSSDTDSDSSQDTSQSTDSSGDSDSGDSGGSPSLSDDPLNVTQSNAPETGPGGIPTGPEVGNRGTSTEEQTTDSGSQTPQGAPPDPSSGPAPEESSMPSTPDVEGGTDSPPSPTTNTDTTDSTTDTSRQDGANIPIPSDSSASVVGRFESDPDQETRQQIQNAAADDRQVFSTTRDGETLFLTGESQADVRDLLNTNTEVNVVNQTPGLDSRGDVNVEDGNVEVTESGEESLEQRREQEATQALNEQFPDVDISSEDTVDTGGQLELDLQTQRQIVAAQQNVDTDQVTFTGNGFRIEGQGTQRQVNPLQQGANAITGAAPVSPVFTLPDTTESTDQSESDTPAGMVEPNQDVQEIDGSELEFDEELPDSARQGPTPGSQNQGQQTVAPTARQVQLGQGDSSDAIQTQFTGLGSVFTTQVTEPVADVSGDVADAATQATQTPVSFLPGTESPQEAFDDYENSISDLFRAPENEEDDPGTIESGTENLTTGAVDIAKTPATLPATVATIGETATGAVDFTGQQIQDDGVVEGSVDSAQAAGETTANFAQSQAQYIANNPLVTAGSLIGSAAIIGGASRLSNSAGLASRAAIQPAEELLGYGGNAALRGTGGALTRVGQATPTRVGNRIEGAGQRTANSAEVLFPNNEPLLFSEEAAIRGAKRVGSATRSGINRARNVNINIDGSVLRDTRGMAGGQRTISIEAEQEAEAEREQAVEEAIEDLPPASEFKSQEEFARQRDLRIARAELEAEAPGSQSLDDLFERQDLAQKRVERRAAERRMEQRLGESPQEAFDDPALRESQIEQLRAREFEGEVERGFESRQETDVEAEQEADNAQDTPRGETAEQSAFADTEAETDARAETPDPQEATTVSPVQEVTDTLFRTESLDEPAATDQPTITDQPTLQDQPFAFDQPTESATEFGPISALQTDQPFRFDQPTDTGIESGIEQQTDRGLEQEAEQETEQELEAELFDFGGELEEGERRGEIGSVAEGTLTNFLNPLTGNELETTRNPANEATLPGFGDNGGGGSLPGFDNDGDGANIPGFGDER